MDRLKPALPFGPGIDCFPGYWTLLRMADANNTVARTMPASPDRVRQQMNYFVIAVGTYVAPLGDKAIATARKLGKVDVGDTDC